MFISLWLLGADSGILGVVTGGLQQRISTFFNVALALLAAALCAAALMRMHSQRAPAADPLDQKIREIQFDGVAFSDGLAFFHDVWHMDFRIDKAVKESGTYSTTPISIHLRDVTLRKALEKFLATANPNLAYEVERNVVRITSQAMLPRIVKTYDVSDLIPPPERMEPPNAQQAASQSLTYTGPSTMISARPTRTEALEEIAKTVSDSIGPDSWASGGGAGEIWFGADRLIVLQTREEHRKIQTFLRELRKANALQAWNRPPATQPAQ
jgi:hypothetical protein